MGDEHKQENEICHPMKQGRRQPRGSFGFLWQSLQGGGKGEILVDLVFRDKEEGETNELVVTLILVKRVVFYFWMKHRTKGS